jgi:hypothetical protein
MTAGVGMSLAAASILASGSIFASMLRFLERIPRSRLESAPTTAEPVPGLLWPLGEGRRGEVSPGGGLT